MNWKKISTILAVVIASGTILGSGWKFYDCKVSKDAFAQFQSEHEDYVAMNDTRWLENYRRNLQQRIWDLKKQYPTTYQSMREYQELAEELRLLEMKIQSYYNRKGK